MNEHSIYQVARLAKKMVPDGNWNKVQWQRARIVNINNFMGQQPGYKPVVKARMMYDNENLYLIFKVNDRFIRCITSEINGPVWEDSCVEFFFAPDTGLPLRYFNLEVNCGGTPLMHYNIIPDTEITKLDISDIRNVEIAHSLPSVIDPEINDPVTWTVEYSIPLTLLAKYSNITSPEPGVEWRGNFFKIAENNSNPHYMTWAVVDNPVPAFHLPQYFGRLRFM